MSPTPQEHTTQQHAADISPTAADGERVVISGMAGLYPQARYVKDLENILYNKLNPVSTENLRWKYNHPGAVQYKAEIPQVDCFDAQFFKVHYKLAKYTDSMSRKLLEQAYEAIYDAGVNPASLSGKKVGVFIGSCFSETEKTFFYHDNDKSGLGIAGCNKSMFSNRISYWLNAKGPSLSIDQSCCSSVAALEAAYKAISSGECEAAVAGGANLCLHPHSSVHFGRMMPLSKDGNTKSFSEEAAGCAKSEAINVLFLQKMKKAKRVYAVVMNVKSEFVSLMSPGPRYGFYRDPEATTRFLKSFYDKTGVSPAAVEYVEAFGSAIAEADKSELEAIDKVFCNEREEPLLVGSVMSNIGYGEAASGISAITKVLLGYHNGLLAGNLHCSAIRRDVAALREGRVSILTDNAQFRRTYTAVNNMSVTGVNAHVLLHGHYKQKDLNRYKANIPRLVTLSGRQESAVERAFEILKSHPIDPEELALLNNVHENNIVGHLGKGYIVLDTNVEGTTVSLGARAEYCDGAQRPLWFVYSGMGSQWAGMGTQLMRIPIFAAAIERCRKILEPKGLDIVHIITSSDKTIFNNILHSFVGIAAVQIGLTDVLLQLGLVPDKIIGHSVGELGCAYADGCLTAEEMIMSAYSRGRVSLETPFIRGSMAAVGVGAQQMVTMCPPEIEIACHNSAESCTISGPAEAMRAFVSELSAKSIFAKEVPCSNIAYHSRYIADAGPRLLKYLKEVITKPRARSERWVSSSVPRGRWQEPNAKYSSAEYHTNNLLSPVLFEEASLLIPADAVLVEVAPHGLLQAILKRALPNSTENIPLTRREHSDNVVMLLDAIGKLYLLGYNPKVRVLYPQVEFPVSTGTPFLSHFVEWANNEKWVLPLYQSDLKKQSSSCTFLVSVLDNEYSYLKGHVIENKLLVPFSFALVAAWDTLAMTLDVPKKSLSVEFTDVKLYAQPIMHQQKITRLNVALQRGSGWFEIMNENSLVATGFITVIKPLKNVKNVGSESESIPLVQTWMLNVQDVYRVLHERGYAYSGRFRSILSTNCSMSEAKISFNNNWVTLIDGILQLNMLKYTHSGICLLDRIQRLVIHPKEILDNIKLYSGEENYCDVKLSEVQGRTSCNGVTIENVRFRDMFRIKDARTTLETLKFIPRFYSKFDVTTSLDVLLQIVAENVPQDKVNVIGLNIDPNALLFIERNRLAAKSFPGTMINYRHISVTALNADENIFKNVDLVLVKNLSKHEKIAQTLHCLLRHNTFIINEEEISAGESEMLPMNYYKVVSVLKNAETQLELACWKPTVLAPMSSAFTVRTESDLHILANARNNCSAQKGLLVLTSYPPVTGLISLVKQWRKDTTRNRVHIIMVKSNSKKNFGSNEDLDVSLAYNIFDNGVCGGIYFLPVEETVEVKDVAVTLQSEVLGDLNSLQWIQAPPLSNKGILISVQYAGINMSDVKRALGTIPIKDNCKSYGMDFSGITERGERVMGLLPNGAVSSYILARPEFMWPVPEHWTLEDAGTVPLAYVFAYYCLLIKTDIKLATSQSKQYTVLVHGGAGALGQAVISIALARGWRVFTTVCDLDKRRFLIKLFPQLNEEDIGNSSDACFGDMVLNATNGYGAYVVISGLKGELKNASLRCCARFSTTFDTEQILSGENYAFGMYYLTKERSYLAVDITSIFNDTNTKENKRLHKLVSEGIACGEVRPLTRVTFAPHEATRAFRLLAASRHRGRALLRLRDELATPPLLPRMSTDTAPCHLIVSDSSALGLQITEKLIEHGVKKIHIHLDGSASVSTEYLQSKQMIWKKRNIHVAVTYKNLAEISYISEFSHNEEKIVPIESIHIVACRSLQETVVTNLDLATRAAGAVLKNFVVVTNKQQFGHSTCVQRSNNGLPATLLDVSMLDMDFDDIICHDAIDAIQQAWRKMDTVMVARPKQTSLIRHISALTGLDISKNTANSATLESLGMSIETSPIVRVFLQDVYNVSLNVDSISKLTVQGLKQIEEKLDDHKFTKINGVETFYSLVDSDKLLGTTELVPLPTLANNFEMRDDEFDSSRTFLCIVPGLEGLHERFRKLCERLKLPAYVLQPGLDHPTETPRELALRYSKIIFKTGLKNTFYIMGYETGVIVALELAAILEENGLTGTVFCVGDGPTETQALLERELSAFPTEAALQEVVARHMFALMARGSPAAKVDVLRGCTSSTWSARVDACVRLLLGQVPHSAQYARALLDAAYARIAAVRKAVLTPRPLRSRLVLLRARSELERAGVCSLQQYTNNELVVQELDAPMAHAAADLRAPAIINSYLDDDLLQAFEKKNLCDTYFTIADTFNAQSN